MTKAAKAKALKSPDTRPGKNELRLVPVEGEARSRTLARSMLDPKARHGCLSSIFAGSAFTDDPDLSITDTVAFLNDELAKVARGDMALPSRMLAAQAVSLDTIFTELAQRSQRNMGQYLDAAERYMRLALKAQAASRATLEALARLHQPREQTVRHVHVERGGQAVVADQFHHHAGGSDEKTVEQSHATVIAG